jgi:hypothetical protein
MGAKVGRSSRRRFLSAVTAGTAATAPGAIAWAALDGQALAASGRASAARAPAANPALGLIFDVTRFGAVGDGKTLSTAGLQAALDACKAAGGGLVLVPPGRYLTGALFLHSNLHLHIAAGATLLATQRFSDFPTISGRWEGIERKTHASLLTGIDLENVSITGQGTLDGQGPPWWEAYGATRRLRLERRLPREAEDPPEAPLRFPRPRLINLIRCQASLISGLSFREGPSWNVHLVYCQDVTIDGLNMAGLQAQDCCGIIIDSCKQVRIANCSLASGADCIGIKSGYNEDGRRVGLPSEDIVVTNCNLTQSYAAGIAIGSETAGGIKNVAISNCVITNCKNGVNIRSTRGRGGVVERVRVSNVVMDRLESTALVMVQFFDSIFQGIANPNEPRPGRTAETDSTIRAPVGPGTPTFRDIDFSGLTVGQVNDVGRLEGLPERFITGINIHDVSAPQAKGGLTLLRARDISISRLRLGQLERPALVARQVQGLDLDRLSCGSPGGPAPTVQLDNVADAFIHGCNVPAVAGSFVDQRGANRAVVLEGNRVRGGPEAGVARKT